MSKGSDAANRIASTCLSSLDGEVGKSSMLFFFFTCHLEISLSSIYQNFFFVIMTLNALLLTQD